MALVLVVSLYRVIITKYIIMNITKGCSILGAKLQPCSGMYKVGRPQGALVSPLAWALQPAE